MIEELARGGMGVVYRGYDPDSDRSVAVKLLAGHLLSHKVVRARFAREAEALAKVDHPNVVRVYDYQPLSDSNQPFLVLELVEGETLQGQIERDGPMSPQAAVETCLSLCGAVEACHQAGVLHRDLKPDNVLLGPGGELKLTDFGIARDSDPSTSRTQLTQEGTALGSPQYWAPEQARGELEAISKRTDVYGLGATLFALLTGQAPRSGKRLVEILARIHDPVAAPSSLNPQVPEWLDRVVARALALDPKDRYASVAELAQALERNPAQTAGESSPRRGAGLILLFASLVLLALLGWGFAGGTDADPGPVGPVSPVAVVLDTPVAVSPAPSVSPLPTLSVEELLAQLRAQLRASDWEQALRTANAVLELRPDSSVALCDRGVARSMLGKKGTGDFTRALQLSPNYARGYLLRGVARGKAGEWTHALADLDEAIRLRPSSAKAHFRRAWAYAGLGRWQRAAEACSDAIALDPGLSVAFEARGAARANLGDLKGAIDDWEHALEIDPGASWADQAQANLKQARERLAERWEIPR